MSVRSLPLLFVLAWAGSAFAQDHPLLSAGPMNAYAEMTEVGVWVQTKADASVRLRYWPQGAASPAKAATQTIQTSAVGDHIAVFTIAGLPFGTKFDYEVEINGQLVPRPYPLRFQTQPLWRWQSEPPEFRVAFGSCAYFNDAPFDRPGRPYGGDHEIFDALAKKQPDLMLWLGDNVYYREADWLTESAMRYRWRHNRAFPGLQPLLGFAQHYATWDDHDYGPNDSDRSFRLKGEALRVFADYFPAVRYGTPETPGTFQRFEWGDVEFFMLDDRYHRTPNRMPVDDERTMLGKAQLQWLKDSLVNSQAVFKVVVCGGQMLNPITHYEGFGQFEAERKDLFDFLAKANISG
ncbi:MAG: alkaline phosphatase family protein, partial [Fimbriimonadaceae bacterium]|nr:alkaline phosphatase family protein [Fimbriimonadaceae bacterium]